MGEGQTTSEDGRIDQLERRCRWLALGLGGTAAVLVLSLAVGIWPDYRYHQLDRGHSEIMARTDAWGNAHLMLRSGDGWVWRDVKEYEPEPQSALELLNEQIGPPEGESAVRDESGG